MARIQSEIIECDQQDHLNVVIRGKPKKNGEEVQLRSVDTCAIRANAFTETCKMKCVSLRRETPPTRQTINEVYILVPKKSTEYNYLGFGEKFLIVNAIHGYTSSEFTQGRWA